MRLEVAKSVLGLGWQSSHTLTVEEIRWTRLPVKPNDDQISWINRGGTQNNMVTVIENVPKDLGIPISWKWIFA